MKTCPSIIAIKNENFQQKKFDIFLIFAQNIDCGYTLEPPPTSKNKTDRQTDNNFYFEALVKLHDIQAQNNI